MCLEAHDAATGAVKRGSSTERKQRGNAVCVVGRAGLQMLSQTVLGAVSGLAELRMLPLQAAPTKRPLRYWTLQRHQIYISVYTFLSRVIVLPLITLPSTDTSHSYGRFSTNLVYIQAPKQAHQEADFVRRMCAS